MGAAAKESTANAQRGKKKVKEKLLASNQPVGWMAKRPDFSLMMVSEGMATSTGRLPGDVALAGARSSTRCKARLHSST